MAVPEDIISLWNEFSSQLKTEPFDDLFDSEPRPKPAKKLFALPSSLVNYNRSNLKDIVTDSISKQMPDSEEKTLEVVGSDNTVVGSAFKPAKLYAYEDFHSFLVREGGLDQERFSRLVDDLTPLPHEDFVSFLARSHGLKDEQTILKLRQALTLEPAIEFPSGVSDRPVKMEEDQDLKVLEGEDAASFFVRAGSWESSSAISEELASVGLDEFVDEDAESFFRRTESSSEVDYASSSSYGSPSGGNRGLEHTGTTPLFGANIEAHKYIQQPNAGDFCQEGKNVNS